MALYDGLPLNTPTRVDTTDGTDFQIWATRTTGGGTVETRLTAGGPSATLSGNQQTILTKAQTALTANATYLAIASPTTAQAVAHVATLTKEVNALIRLILNQFDATTGT